MIALSLGQGQAFLGHQQRAAQRSRSARLQLSMAVRRNVLKLHKTGNIKDLRLESEDLEQLATDEVAVDVHAVCVSLVACIG